MNNWEQDWENSFKEKTNSDKEEFLLEKITRLESDNYDLKDKIDDLEYALKLAKDTLQEFKNKIKDCLEEEYLNESI